MQDIDWEILMQVRNMINQDATWNNLVSARLGFPEFHPISLAAQVLQVVSEQSGDP